MLGLAARATVLLGVDSCNVLSSSRAVLEEIEKKVMIGRKNIGVSHMKMSTVKCLRVALLLDYCTSFTAGLNKTECASLR